MKTEDVQELVIRVTADILQIPENEITGNSLFAETLGADSLELLEILLELENHFPTINLVDDCAKVGSVKGLVNYINSQVK